MRSDAGALWENYLVSERIKSQAHAGVRTNRFFRCTQAQQEIDYLEESGGVLCAWEFKWKRGAKPRISKTFTRAYPDAVLSVVSPENYHAFL